MSKALPHTYVYMELGQRGNVRVRCWLLEERFVPAVLILQKSGKKKKDTRIADLAGFTL